MSGDGFMTFWIRDTPNDYSYSQFVYYSRDDPKGVIAQHLQHRPTFGYFIQQEITVDGRLIISLEENSSILRIFYQNKLLKNHKEEKKETSSYGRSGGYGVYGGYGLQQKYGIAKNAIEIDFKNPYEDIDAEGNIQESKIKHVGGGDLSFQNDDLSEYQLPRHKNPIEYFKILHHDIFESEKRYLPNVILTVTQKNEVFLWQENLMTVPFSSLTFLQSDLQFTCIHVFRGYSQFSFFDAAFLDFPPNNPKRHVEVKTSVSRILESSTDKVLALKKEEDTNIFGMYTQNYVETSVDWIFVLNDQIMDIFKAEGLRNFP